MLEGIQRKQAKEPDMIKTPEDYLRMKDVVKEGARAQKTLNEFEKRVPSIILERTGLNVAVFDEEFEFPGQAKVEIGMLGDTARGHCLYVSGSGHVMYLKGEDLEKFFQVHNEHTELEEHFKALRKTLYLKIAAVFDGYPDMGGGVSYDQLTVDYKFGPHTVRLQVVAGKVLCTIEKEVTVATREVTKLTLDAHQLENIDHFLEKYI